MSENTEKKLSAKQKRDIFRRSIKTINKADKGQIFRNHFEYLTLLATEFAGIYLSALVVDGIAEGKPIGQLIMYAAIVTGFDLLMFLLRYTVMSREESHFFTYKQNMRKFLWQKVMDMDYIHLEDTGTQNDFSRAQRQSLNANTGFGAVRQRLTWFAGGIFMIVIGIILISPIAFRKPTVTSGFTGFIQSVWGLLSVAVLVAALEIVKAMVFNKKAVQSFENIQNDDKMIQARRAESFYESFVLDNYRNGKEIRLYAEQDLIENEFEESRKVIESSWIKGYFGALAPNLACQIINILTKMLMYGFAILRAMSGMLSPGEVIAFALYFAKISAGVSEVSDAYGMLQMTPAFCKQYFDFLDIPDEKYKGTIPTEKRDDNEYEFEFKHVWFRYPNSEQYVLQDVNLKWRIGEKMALVGHNGSGKSTLIKLLCRLYDATDGVITLNGVDIRKYNYEEYMALFSVVFQDSKLFSFSLAENVAADTEIDRKLAEECVRRAGLSKRLDSLPDGIDSYLYKNFNESGVEISGGEAQKLCLARAIYKGSPFIVLDEPTAALDPISEHDIYTKFNSIVGTRTAIYISHRLSSCRFCDDITVLDGGKIVERGSHDKLISDGGIYSSMWSAQAEYYKDTAGELYA